MKQYSNRQEFRYDADNVFSHFPEAQQRMTMRPSVWWNTTVLIVILYLYVTMVQYIRAAEISSTTGAMRAKQYYSGEKLSQYRTREDPDEELDIASVESEPHHQVTICLSILNSRSILVGLKTA